MIEKRKNKKIICFLCLCFLLLLSDGQVVQATEIKEPEISGEELDNEVDEANQDRFTEGSPWLDNADDSIYSNNVDAGEEEQKIEPEKPGTVEKYLSELVRNAASSLIALLEENLGAGLDRIIYGRVGSGKPNSVNIYGFELRSGNPYGVTASICYTLVRSMVFVLLGISFVYLLAKSAWTGQTSQGRERVKSNFYATAMKFSMMTLMPYLFDIVVYIRDVVLYGIKEVTGQMITGGATLSLSNAFLVNAEMTGRFVDALMYLGTVLLTLYFAVIYVALAIDLLICFVSFPLMCLLHSPKKDLLGNWVMNVMSDIITPVLDAVLLLVPLLTSMMLADVIKGIAIIQMIMCMLIIPSRNRIKALLGVQSNERGGIFGIMALASLGRALTGKVKNMFGRAGDIRSDMQKSRMHKELAEADEEEKDSLLGGFGGNGGAKSLSGNGLGQVSPDDRQGREEMNTSGLNQAAEDTYEPGRNRNDFDEDISQEWSNDDIENGREPDMAEAYGEEAENTEDVVVPDTGSKSGTDVSSADDIPAGIDENGTSDDEEAAAPLTRNEVLRNLDKAMEQKQDSIDRLRAQKVSYQNDEKQKARQMLDYERGSEEYRQLEKQRADAAVHAAQTEQKIAGQMRNMNQLKNQMKELKGSQTGPVPSAFDEARAEILCKRANIDNFEQPEFKNALSNAQMQKLYRQRAAANAVKGAASLGGAAAGGVLLGGSAMFMQPSNVAIAAAAGAVGGSGLGGGAAGAGMAGVRMAGKGIQAGYRGYNSLRRGYIAAASSVDFETVYSRPSQSPAPPSADIPKVPYQGKPAYQQQSTNHGVNGQEAKGSAMQSGNTADPLQPVISEQEIGQRIIKEVEYDSAQAIKKVIAPSGEFRTSAALLALERANIETEKYVAAVKETQGINLTQQQERAKRIELQTDFMTEEVMKKLTLHSDYEKGTEKFHSAMEIIREKVRAIVERQNKDIF